MYISKIRISSYKSFRESEELSFQQGINVIIGPNNSGKTALLEALSGGIVHKPFKNAELLNYTHSN